MGKLLFSGNVGIIFIEQLQEIHEKHDIIAISRRISFIWYIDLWMNLSINFYLMRKFITENV